MAMDTLIVICNHGSSMKAQEILMEILEGEAYCYLCDNIDCSYEIVCSLKKFCRDVVDNSMKGYDFVAEIIMADEDLVKQINAMRDSEIFNRPKVRSVLDESVEFGGSIEVQGLNNMVGNIEERLRSQAVTPDVGGEGLGISKSNGGLAFEVDSTRKPPVKFDRKYNVKIQEEHDLRARVKGITIAQEINDHAGEYENYPYTREQIDDDFRRSQVSDAINADKKKPQDETDIVDQLLDEYLHPQHKNYNGEFYDADPGMENDQNYAEYYKQAEFPQDLQAARAHRKAVQKDLRYEARQGKWKRLIPPKFAEIAYQKAESLRPLRNPQQFVEDFFEYLIDERRDSITIKQTLAHLRSLLKFHIGISFSPQIFFRIPIRKNFQYPIDDRLHLRDAGLRQPGNPKNLSGVLTGAEFFIEKSPRQQARGFIVLSILLFREVPGC